ncbi:MAG: hypothetical protein R3E18_12190 [Sphingomonadaceae bacterium]
MSARAQTVRLSPSQYRLLADFAKRRGVSDYAMLARVVEAGFDTLLHSRSQEADLAELVREIASMSVRLAEAEGVLDRTLFTACAGYAYARHAALGMKKSDDLIAREARAAFERQRSLALSQDQRAG